MANSTFRFWDIVATTVRIGEQNYYITYDTGECSYAEHLGGPAAFAYISDDVDSELELGWVDYADFCDQIPAVGPKHPDWRALALRCAERGYRLSEPGSCRPALTDEEYLAVEAV